MQLATPPVRTICPRRRMVFDDTYDMYRHFRDLKMSIDGHFFSGCTLAALIHTGMFLECDL